ncbi:hypothetical protein [Virgibacillus sp. LDC-1]|uniref:hypothetical protein n=1 Tax=Virgibacillus sp. LDC-1 TaxID=3039856 RepID=UPI0024DEC2C5|nr:hypothetical protein [Virgibacillus sp. LDC-1]
MKTFVLTTVGALVLAGGAGSVHAFQNDQAPENEAKVNISQLAGAEAEDIQAFIEYASLEAHVDVSDYEAYVVEDNAYKRVIVLKKNNQVQVKSIFVKETNRHKIIDFQEGLLFQGILGNDQAEATDDKQESTEQTEAVDLDDYPEYDNLDEHVDVDDYHGTVVEDNANKRIIVLKDDNGSSVFKSIFVKETNMHKIVDLNGGGLIFEGVIGTDDDIDDEADDDQGEEENEAEIDFDAFLEYDNLDDVIDVDEDELVLVEDNDSKRVLLALDDNGQPRYKSIFVKETNRHKVIDLRNGEIFNGILK